MWHRLLQSWLVADEHFGSNEMNSAVNESKWCRVIIFPKGIHFFWSTAKISFMGFAIVTQLKLKTVNGFSFHDALGDIRTFKPSQQWTSWSVTLQGEEKLGKGGGGVKSRADQHKCQFPLRFFWLLFLNGYRKISNLTRYFMWFHFKIKMCLNLVWSR
jgi:hypothetical protein